MVDGDSIDIISSGHLCLDLYPAMESVPLESLSSPGKLFETGALEMSTGGSVSNTGLALHRLGANVRLLATVGDDLIGRVIVAFLKDRDPHLADYVTVQSGQPSSYSVLLSPQNVDRIILHCTGTNDTFGPQDIDYSLLESAKIFHLGYPTLLPGLIIDDGAPLCDLYRRAKATGIVTSLDLALPDPNKFAGQVNWPKILGCTLAHVDIFLPSIEEILFMLRRQDYDRWGGAVLPHLTRAYLSSLADDLLAMGPLVVGLKLGEYGIYLKTAPVLDAGRLSRLSLDLDTWAGVELWHPAFEVKVIGTTGAGDSAYAAFLVSLLHSLSPQQGLKMACAVGGFNVEKADATSGVKSWEETQARIAAGWPTSERVLSGFEPI